jgi:hypothetical protein
VPSVTVLFLQSKANVKDPVASPSDLQHEKRVSYRSVQPEDGAITYPDLSEQANVWLRYMVLFLQSTAKDTVSSFVSPAPVAMQSLQIMLVPPMYRPAHDSGHSALHSYRG